MNHGFQSVGRNHQSQGFSLLEMMVAVAIMGLSLAALYQAAGGATRAVGIDEKMAYGVELANSLLATHATVPSTGMRESGETDSGFRWEVSTDPVVIDGDEGVFGEGMLQHIQVSVFWPDGAGERTFALHSVVAGRPEAQ